MTAPTNAPLLHHEESLMKSRSSQCEAQLCTEDTAFLGREGVSLGVTPPEQPIAPQIQPRASISTKETPTPLRKATTTGNLQSQPTIITPKRSFQPQVRGLANIDQANSPRASAEKATTSGLTTNNSGKSTPVPEDFFKKYQSLLSPSAFSEFRSVFSRVRNFQARLWQCSDHNKSPFSIWSPSKVQDLKRQNRDVLLIQDVDIRCLLALDAEFNLDPTFILSYGKGTMRSLNSPVPRDECHQAKTGLAGSWYTTAGHINGNFLWMKGEWQPSANMSWQVDLGDQSCDRNLSANRPWWQEDCRQIRHARLHGFNNQYFTSVSACYCLSDRLRESRSGNRYKFPF
jgi:hypothetical protein